MAPLALRLRSALLVALLCALAGCGGAHASQPAVRVGSAAIGDELVAHWMSVLVGKGSNGKKEGPSVPAPPKYTACIADQRAHRRPPFANAPRPTDAQLKAYCEYEYQRFKLKALYLLISHAWTTGEAAELGVKVDRRELQHQLSEFELGVAPSRAAFRRDLGFWRARLSDILLSLEDEQLATRIQAKVEATGTTAKQKEEAFARFGRAFEQKWVARTSCARGYVVPICRNFKPPKVPAALVPPSVPLTDMVAAGGNE